MSGDPIDRTCLFTGEALGPTTKVEHTIPQSLGGRIRSRLTVSSSFNAAAGDTVDPWLARSYCAIINRLAPALPAGGPRPKFAVRPEGVPDGNYVFELGGVLSLQNIRVISRNPQTGRPERVASTDPAALARFARSMGVEPATLRYESAANVTPSVAGASVIPVAMEIELAALKAVLTTFDHLLTDSSRNFVRHDALRSLRETMRAAIMDRQPPAHAFMSRVVLGLQYDRTQGIDRIRAASGIPSSPFEHVMVASGRSATRTLDAVWNVFGCDPWGFRLCEDWRGEDFTCLVVSGVVRGSAVSAPYWHRGTGLLLSHTPYRSHQVLIGSQESTRAKVHDATARVMAERGRGFQSAVNHVEHQCDEFVQRSLSATARSLGADDRGRCSLAAGFAERIRRMFAMRLTDRPDLQQLIHVSVTRQLDAMPADVRVQTIDSARDGDASIDWATWLMATRAVLDELRGPLGLPGDITLRSFEVCDDPLGSRAVGSTSAS